ncbi:MAG: FKBP-type peptidyl-prolyl cis-transisomerase [Bacteroidetes bacterium]|nr:FKBP-type peptidyl-prolyl cis-transisomerase [Bacteroidota bacterium]
MNVTQTNVDSVNAILTVSIAKADYQEKLDKSLKDFRKKANVPGFRPGTVPVGMVKKMYGKSILAEEINKLVGENLYKYIQDNKLDVLGEPLPNLEKQQPIDFAHEGDYEFSFDVALAPEINLSLSKNDEIPYYKIEATEELIERQVASYKQNYGKYDSVQEEAKDTDLLKGIVVELEGGQPKEGGINLENAVLMASYMKDKEEQDKFVGAKVGDKIIFNPGKAYDGNETEIASFLHVEKEELQDIAAEFSFEITDVTRYQEAELDQALFDKVFGENVVDTEADFHTKVKEVIEQQFAPDSDYKFLLDARVLLESKVGELQFADALLKRWLLETGKDKTPEAVEAEYPAIVKDLTYHLIKEKIVKDNGLKVEESDVTAIAKEAARAQFAQYGMMSMAEDMVENYAKEILKNKDTARNLVDRAMESKIIESLKSTLGVKEESISVEEFKKFFEENKLEA